MVAETDHTLSEFRIRELKRNEMTYCCFDTKIRQQPPSSSRLEEEEEEKEEKEEGEDWDEVWIVCLSFLDASSHLYKRVCPSVHPSVRRHPPPSLPLSPPLSPGEIVLFLLLLLETRRPWGLLTNFRIKATIGRFVSYRFSYPKLCSPVASVQMRNFQILIYKGNNIIE